MSKRVRVDSIKTGDSILTTTGMRTVCKVNITPNFITLYVDDPATPPHFVTALDYGRDASVTVERAK